MISFEPEWEWGSAFDDYPEEDEGFFNDTDWFPYIKEIKHIIIKNGIENIGAYAFYGAESLVDVTLPESVKSVDHEAF